MLAVLHLHLWWFYLIIAFLWNFKVVSSQLESWKRTLPKSKKKKVLLTKSYLLLTSSREACAFIWECFKKNMKVWSFAKLGGGMGGVAEGSKVPFISYSLILVWASMSKQGWLKVHYNMRSLIFKYEKIELLVFIYEISGELVFIYGISGWSSPFGSVHVLQQENNQTNVLIKYFR